MSFDSQEHQNYSDEQLSSQALSQVSFINKVYGLMTAGLIITAGVSHYVACNVPPRNLQGMIMPCIVVEFLLVIALSAMAMKMSSALSLLCFGGYAVLNGITLSSIFYVYSLGSIGTVFFITAGTFGSMCLYGTVTGKDLTSIGNICMMAIWGIVLATLINIFVRSDAMTTMISIVGVLIFTGLTAYDAQKIKKLHEANINHTGIAVLGALTLYLDFINMFLYLLRFFGKRK